MTDFETKYQTVVNNRILNQFLIDKINDKNKSVNEIFRQERTAYYEQEATTNMMSFHKIVNFVYWFMFTLLIILFIYKKQITIKLTKSNFINIAIIVVFAIYPHIMGYVYEAIIKFIEFLWGLLPKNVYSLS